MKTSSESREILYGCDHNRCNDNATAFYLKSLVDQYYDLTSIRKAFETTTYMTSTQIDLTYSYSTDQSMKTSNEILSTDTLFTLTNTTFHIKNSTTSFYQSYIIIYYIIVYLFLNTVKSA